MSDTLGSVVMEAIQLRDRLKADGVSGEALERGLAEVLRQVWPRPKDRTEPWRDLCDTCRDYGLEMFTCTGDATCGRVKAHGPHDYGRACWCAAGKRHQEPRAPTPEDAVTRAAKQQKPSRWGR